MTRADRLLFLATVILSFLAVSISAGLVPGVTAGTPVAWVAGVLTAVCFVLVGRRIFAQPRRSTDGVGARGWQPAADKRYRLMAGVLIAVAIVIFAGGIYWFGPDSDSLPIWFLVFVGGLLFGASTLLVKSLRTK